MYLRRLPSGKWQATARLPNGRRRTYTAALKGEAREWASVQEARIRRGDWADLKTSRVLFEHWRERWWAARVVEPETRRSDASCLKRLDERFAGTPLPAITRMDVQSWVRSLEQQGVGPQVIRRSYNLLNSILGAAVLEGIIPQTPCRKIALPATPPKAPHWFTPEQVAAIMLHLPERHAVATGLMCWSGLRWGEMAGLRIRDLDVERGRVSVVGVRTQAGAWKEYPKSSQSRRDVPVRIEILRAMVTLAGARHSDDPVFTTPRQDRPWSASNWRKVWDAAVAAAGAPPYSPHACRHTAASWLVQQGVSLYKVQYLLGHENHSTTQRYAHLAPDAHDQIEEAWGRMAPTAIESWSA